MISSRLNSLKFNQCSKKILNGLKYSTASEIIHRKTKVKDVDINYVEMDGNPNHVVFCMPGSLSSIELDFIPLLKRLNPSKFKAIAWDPPGYGRSRPPDRDFSGNVNDRDATYALELMKKLGHKKYSILGWSMGGQTAYAMAVKDPNSLRKLVTWGTSGYWDEHSHNLCKTMKHIGPSVIPKSRLNQLHKAYGEEYTRKLFYDWTGCGDEITELIGFTKNGIATTEGLNKIKCPTLLVHGSNDKFVGEEQPGYLNANIKNSRLVTIHEGTHSAHVGKTEDAFLEVVEAFLSTDL